MHTYKKIIFIFGGAVLIFVGILVIRSLIVKGTIEDKISALTGLPAKIDSFESGYFLKLKGLKLKNPQGFEDAPMLDISLLSIDENLGEMEINVKELLVEKSPTGRLNIDYLNPADEERLPLKVNRLKVHINKVKFKDTAAQKTKEFNVDIHKQYTGLSDPSDAVDIIVKEGVKDTSLPEDEGIDPGEPDPPGEDIPPDNDNNPPEDGNGGQPPTWKGGWYE